MSVVYDRIDIVNQAMARLGAEPLQTLEDVVPGAQAALKRSSSQGEATFAPTQLLRARGCAATILV